MVDLSIIILSYNTGKKTIACIDSLVKEYRAQLEAREYEIIIVDNNSSDKSVLLISKFARDNKSIPIHLIESKENLGFGRGNNLAASQAKGKLLLFLNSDTVVLDAGIAGMVHFMNSESSVGVLGGKLYNSDGGVQKSVGAFYTVPTLFLSLFGGGRLGFMRQSPSFIADVDWVSGALCMVRKDVFVKTEGFDKDIFMYVEDMDFCYRVRKIGYRVAFFPDIMVKHSEMGSSNRTFAITSIYKGVLHFFRKHKSKREYEAARFLLNVKARIGVILGTLLGNSYLSETYKKALQLSYE